MSPSRGRVRQFKIARVWFFVGLGIILGSLAVGVYGFYQHLGAKEDRQRLSSLLHENSTQQDQIKSIAGDLDDLKEQMVRLRQMDKRIRVIANLEHGNSGVKVRGIGGVNPDEGLLKSLGHEPKERLVGRVREELGNMQDFAVMQEESFLTLEDGLRDKQKLLTHTPSVWPTNGWLTSGFGYRESPFTGMREFHPGVDVATRLGTPIIAPAAGVVVEIGKAEAPGRFVRLNHGFGYQTYYAHLEDVVVKKGQQVKRGEMIATVGNTGRSTGPHLHYEVLVKDLPVNPLRYALD